MVSSRYRHSYLRKIAELERYTHYRGRPTQRGDSRPGTGRGVAARRERGVQLRPGPNRDHASNGNYPTNCGAGRDGNNRACSRPDRDGDRSGLRICRRDGSADRGA